MGAGPEGPRPNGATAGRAFVLYLAGSAADGKIKNGRPGGDGGGRTKMGQLRAGGRRSSLRLDTARQTGRLPDRRTTAGKKRDRVERSGTLARLFADDGQRETAFPST